MAQKLPPFPGPGLIKTAPPAAPALSSEQRVALIRRGNEFFNKGSIAEARKIFLTTRYTDGIIRLGDYYYKQGRHLQALQMYIIAPDNSKKDAMVEKMARIVQNWLSEE
jgi:hypothetical protein